MDATLYASIANAVDYALLSAARYRDPKQTVNLIRLRDDLAAHFPTQHAETLAGRSEERDAE